MMKIWWYVFPNDKNYLWQTVVHISIKREYCMKDVMDGTPIPANIIPLYIHVSFPFSNYNFVFQVELSPNDDNQFYQLLVCCNITVEG